MKAMLLAAVATVVALVIGGSAAAVPNAPASPAAQDEVVLSSGTAFDVVSLSFADLSATGIALGVEGAARVEVTLPAGYTMDLAQASGTEVGDLSAFLTSATGDSTASVDARLVSDDPAKYASDAAAQACAPGAHAAVWRADFSVLGGHTLSLPLFVDTPASGGFVVRLCPQWAPSASLSTGIRAAGLLLIVNGMHGPDSRGSYVSSALVTPSIEGSFQPDEPHAYELRVVVPVPNVLTLHATYDKRTKSALLRGRLTAAGVPEAGVPVDISAYTSSTDFGDDAKPVTTDKGGAFSTRRPVVKTTRFTAEVSQSQPRACRSPSTAPGGCVETTGRPDSASANVILRGPRDPRFVKRNVDQARAARTALKLSDLGSGWQSFVPDPFDEDCPKFRPNLSDLTTTGEASSPVFYAVSDDQYSAAYSEVSVYRESAQAQKAFSRIAQVAEAQCYADDVKDDPEIEDVAVSRLSLPRTGDQSKAFRVSYVYEGTTYVADLVSLRRGRLVAHLLFAAAGGPLSSEQALVAKVAGRAGRG